MAPRQARGSSTYQIIKLILHIKLVVDSERGQFTDRVEESGCWELNPVFLRPERSVIPIHHTPPSRAEARFGGQRPVKVIIPDTF